MLAGAAAAALGACDHHAEIAGPSGLPYACADGRTARIHYGGGDPNRMPARLSFDGREFEMAPDPAMSGLRYRSENGLTPGSALIWAAEGEEAALLEAPLDPAAAQGEREVLRCARVREGESEAAGAHGPHGEDH
jgi:hypothetical protein